MPVRGKRPTRGRRRRDGDTGRDRRGADAVRERSGRLCGMGAPARGFDGRGRRRDRLAKRHATIGSALRLGESSTRRRRRDPRARHCRRRLRRQRLRNRGRGRDLRLERRLWALRSRRLRRVGGNRRGRHRRDRRRLRLGRHDGRASRQERQRIDVPVRIGQAAHTEVDVRRACDRVRALADAADDRALGDGAPAGDLDRAELEERDGVAVRSLDRDDAAAARNRADE
jgi:hypothetical protein